MSVQDKLERTLREMHIILSRGKVLEADKNYVIISKKDMLEQLNSLSRTVVEMMDTYEVTTESRGRAEREAYKRQTEIIRDANYQAEDIYAASVIYTEDALGRIQDIMDAAGISIKNALTELNRSIEEEKRIVRSNQVELKSQLEDLKDTAKYIKIIEEKNREMAKAKAKKSEEESAGKQEQTSEAESDFAAITPEIKINEEYFERAGLTPDGLPIETEEKTYSPPEIKINTEYFEKAGIPIEGAESEQQAEPEETETEDFASEDLDIEYFQWRDDQSGKNQKKEKKGWGRRPFGRKDKS